MLQAIVVQTLNTLGVSVPSAWAERLAEAGDDSTEAVMKAALTCQDEGTSSSCWKAEPLLNPSCAMSSRLSSAFAVLLAVLPALTAFDANAAEPDEERSPTLFAHCEPIDVKVILGGGTEALGVTQKLLRDPLVAMLSAAGIFGKESSTNQTLVIAAEVFGDNLLIELDFVRQLRDTGYSHGGEVVVYRDVASGTHEGDFNRLIEPAVLLSAQFRDAYLSANEESCPEFVAKEHVRLAIGLGETRPEACLDAHQIIYDEALQNCGGDSLDHFEWIDCPAGTADIRCVSRSCYCAKRLDSLHQCTILWQCRSCAEAGDSLN